MKYILYYTTRQIPFGSSHVLERIRYLVCIQKKHSDILMTQSIESAVRSNVANHPLDEVTPTIRTCNCTLDSCPICLIKLLIPAISDYSWTTIKMSILVGTIMGGDFFSHPRQPRKKKENQSNSPSTFFVLTYQLRETISPSQK